MFKFNMLSIKTDSHGSEDDLLATLHGWALIYWEVSVKSDIFPLHEQLVFRPNCASAKSVQQLRCSLTSGAVF